MHRLCGRPDPGVQRIRGGAGSPALDDAYCRCQNRHPTRIDAGHGG